MSIVFNRRIATISPAATSGLSERVAALKAAGRDIIGLSTGEPDFDTPQHIKQAAIAAIEAGQTKYPPTGGSAALKSAIIDKFARDNQLQFSPSEIFVANGVKQVLYNMLQTLVDTDDEVIFAAPYWVSYPQMVKAAGGQSVIIATEQSNRFKISPQQLHDAISDKTKVLLFCSPNNPTGTSYSRAEMQAIGEVLLQYPDIWIITDDIYEHLLWTEEPFCHLLNACPALKDRTLIANGVSKTYAMTGWRIGYGAGPEEVIKAIVRLQSHSTSGACSIAQAAAVAALNGPTDAINEMRDIFKLRHDHLYQALDKIDGIEVEPSDGTFYLFVNIKKWLDRLPQIKNDVEFVEWMIEQVGVAVVPGSAFGCDDHLRFSFAVGIEQLDRVIQRLQQLAQLK